MRIGIAAGPARRFQVGDPGIQRLDVLAGRTLERMFAAQQAAPKGGIALDPETARMLDGAARVVGTLSPGEPREGGILVGGLRATVLPVPWATEAAEVVAPARLREWVLRPVVARLQEQQGAFLTEMRPVVALFIAFSGLDYDGDEDAGRKLGGFVGWVQQVLARYGGFLIECVLGDKGSYLYAAFGAPVAHEDDMWRALTAALVLRAPPSEVCSVRGIRMGLSRGLARTGAYGGPSRRTYGIQGDEVNVAARLMQAAAGGQVLVSESALETVESRFTWQRVAPLWLKGKARAVPIRALVDAAHRPMVRLNEPAYALPMVGREAELTAVSACLEAARQGSGQTLCITGEAGLGKSRLIAESVRRATEAGFSVAVAQGYSHATQATYAAWTSCWPVFFELDSATPQDAQVRQLRASLSALGEDLLVRLPLLGPVTGLNVPDTEVTRSFEAKLRKSSLESLLAECVARRSRRSPLLFVLEDYHWFDPLSRELLETLVRSCKSRPVCYLLGYRPPVAGTAWCDALRSLPSMQEVPLASLPDAAANQLIERKLAARPGLPPPVLERIRRMAEGNPFYLEEMVNYVQTRAAGMTDPSDLENLELPESLHALVLTRIDQLTESQKITAKVASVIGRVFRASVLWGSYPELGSLAAVLCSLEALNAEEITAVSAQEPEMVYLFRHVVTQEAAYESLPYSRRAEIHERVGTFLETALARTSEPSLDLLAYHFGRSDNVAKKRSYLLAAGCAAQARYANEVALDYFRRALPWVVGADRVDALLHHGQVLELLGRWAEARNAYDEAVAIARQSEQPGLVARGNLAVGELLRKQAQYSEAAERLELARGVFVAVGDSAGIAQVLHCAGTLAAQQGHHEQAQRFYLESLDLRRRLGDQPRTASLLSNLAILAHQYTFQHEEARRLYEESLAIRRELGDRWAIANSLNNLGVLLHDEGRLGEARTVLEESVALNRQVGDRWAIANSVSSLAAVTLDQEDVATSRTLLADSLAINQELREPRGLAFVFEYIARLAALQGRAERTLRLIAAATSLRARIHAPLSPEELSRQERWLREVSAGLAPELKQRWMQESRDWPLETAVDYAMADL